MKRIVLVALVVFGLAQFIRPDLSVPEVNGSLDLIAMTDPPEAIAHALKVACYDCHSYQSRYPWYDRITPVNWWVQHHVEEAREEGNFSRWGELPDKKRRHFREEAGEMIADGEMPLPSYVNMHPEAKLSDDQRKMLMDFFSQHAP